MDSSKIAAILAVAGVALLAFGGGAHAVTPTNGGNVTNKKRLYDQLRALPMLDEDQRLFLMLVAHGESGYSPTAHNDSASESAASGKAFDRLVEQGRINPACGYTRAQVSIGSVGRFQRLAPYFINDLRDVAPCIDPMAGLDGIHDIVSAIQNAAALSRNPNWNGRASGLRGGWGTLSWIDGPPADKLEKWKRHADEAHLMGPGVYGGAFLDKKINQFPKDPAGVLAALRAFDANQTVA
jgi:hypothetical protein